MITYCIIYFQAEIEAALEKVCSLVPSLYKSECDDLVKKYTNEFIQLLLRLQPSAICRALDLCTSTTIPVAPQVCDDYFVLKLKSCVSSIIMFTFALNSP